MGSSANTVPSVSPVFAPGPIVLPSPLENSARQNFLFSQYIQFLNILNQTTFTTPTNQSRTLLFARLDFFNDYEKLAKEQEEIGKEGEKKTMIVNCPHKNRKHYAKVLY